MSKEKKDNSNDRLLYKKESAWSFFTEKNMSKIFALADQYKEFLDNKCEHEVVDFIVKRAQKNGFKNLDNATKKDKKIFFDVHGVAAGLAILGDPKNLHRGFLITASHIDSPRLDLKQVPLFESSNMAYLKTHYYGGIKKYHWPARALSLHGTIYLKSGKKLNIVIGESDQDPVLAISDLLPHLAKTQYQKSATDLIEGEQLNVIVGNIPYQFKKEEGQVKLNVLHLLFDRYQIEERDFLKADLHLLPQGKARDVGLDASFVGGYGQDDHICAFTAQEAIFKNQNLSKNIVALFFNKEEIGSVGPGAATPNRLMYIYAKLLALHGQDSYLTNLQALASSQALSTDVTAGHDPQWPEAFELNNSAIMGKGVAISKYCGVGGKYSANDAHAHFLAQLLNMLHRKNIPFQTAELGKIDQGGGGTISGILAELNMHVVDCGPALLSMHAPFELSSKVDLFTALQLNEAFYQEM